MRQMPHTFTKHLPLALTTKLLFIAAFMSHVSKKTPHPGPRANECLRGWTLGDFYQNWVSVHDSLGSAHVLQYALPNTGRLVLEHCCERVHLLHFNVSHSNVDVIVSL